MIFLLLILLLFLINLTIKCNNNIQKDNFKENNILKPGTSEIRVLNYMKEHYFSFDKNSNYDSDLIVNIFSIDCKIKVDNRENIKFNDDTFSFILEKKQLNDNANIKITPIKDIIDGESRYNYENRNCRIIINSIFSNSMELNVSKSEPTILFFNESLKKFIIKYEIKNTEEDSFLTFSFIFNEKTNFTINILNNNNTLYVEKKTITNSTNIYFDSTQIKEFERKNLAISIEYLDVNPILLTFKVIDNNSISLLQKNYLNYGFITSKYLYQYYYMEIYEKEEGEIMLHNKRLNGKLLGFIEKKEDPQNIDINIENFQNKNKSKSLVFDKHTQKLSFNYSDTNDCQKGCHLLIIYCHEIEIIETEIGHEFTLLVRVWDETDFSPQIINIPFNEYILGYFERDSINHHYYSISIPEGTEKIIIQIDANNIEGFIGGGKYKLITVKENNELIDLKLNKKTNKNLITFELNENSIINNTIVSLAFRPKYLFSIIPCFYYFRIFYLMNRNEKLILPLDSNLGNICKPEREHEGSKYYCYFFLPNKYNEFSKKFSISISDRIDLYTIYCYENGDNEKRIMNYYYFENNYLDYIFFKFEFDDDEVKNILSTFYNGESDINTYVYSSQIYQLNDINNKNLNLTLDKDYFSLVLMWISGIGYLSWNTIDDDQFNSIGLSNNYDCKPIFFPLKNLNSFKFDKNELFVFYMKIKYQGKNELEEIYYGETFHELAIKKNFPIFYYMKTNQDSSEISYRIGDIIDVNYKIEAYVLEENDINKKLNGDYIQLNNAIQGKSDPFYKNGVLQINNINKNSANDYKYILLKIGEVGNVMDDRVTINFISLYKKNSSYILPINEYVSGSLNDNITSKEYILRVLNNKTCLIEFSSNYDDIKLKLKYGKSQQKYTEYGIQKFRIDETNNNITISIENQNKRPNANYILRYYYSFKEDENVYTFDILSYEITELNKTKDAVSLQFKFDNIKIKNHEKSVEKYDIKLRIHGALFLKNENDDEKKDTLAIISSEPKYKNHTIVSSAHKEFIIIFDNMERIHDDKYIFELQIKVNVLISPLIEELLVFSKEIDLKDQLHVINKDMIIGIIIVVFIIVTVIIIILILWSKQKKRITAFKERIMSISFVKGISDDEIIQEVKKEEEEKEEAFI